MSEAITNREMTLAVDLHDNGMEQLDHLMLEEQRAKLMTVAGLVVGENVLYIGNPGGGKSTLTENFYRLVDGIDPEHVADVPHRSDLTGAQLVGDSIDAVKRIQHGSAKPTEERISTDVTPIITQESKIIRFDEVNRLNTYTVNAALGILATRNITVRGQTKPLNNLEMVVSAMNPAETLQASFRMADALVSRQAMGVILGGHEDPTERERIADRIWGGWTPSPEAMKAVINLDELHVVREAAGNVIVSDEMRQVGKQLGIGASNELRNAGIPEADGRINVQLRNASQALALMRGRTTVNSGDIHDATDFLMTARLGAKGKPVEEIKQIIDKIAA